jgi:hypothetical protein
MKALPIRQPHAEAILRGVKHIDYRSRPTKVRGRVYVYASLGRYSPEEEAKMLTMYGMSDVNVDDLPRGVLVGTVELWECSASGLDYHWHLLNPERATELLKPTNRPGSAWFDPF